MSAPKAAKRPPPNGLALCDRVCDHAVAAFAIWTLLAHAAVFVGAGLDVLLLAAGAAALCGTVALARGLWRHGLGRAQVGDSRFRAEDVSHTRDAVAPGPLLRVAVAGLSAALAGAFFMAPAAEPGLASPWIGGIWAGAIALAVLLVVRETLLPGPGGAPSPVAPGQAPPRHLAGSTAALVAMALACSLVATGAKRPDVDDAFYLNMAVAAVDHPEAPLLAGDTLHGVPGVALALPVYRVHTLELLEAAVARLTGRPVLDVAHVALPIFAALLLPFAWARLWRVLVGETGDRWLWGVGAVLAFLACAGDATHGWGDLGLVRLHQGKAIVLVVGLPLLLSLAIEFARAPGLRRWLLLAAAQVAALGASASALWLAPAVSAIGLVAGAGPVRGSRGRSARGVMMGLLASSYVLALGLVLRGGTADAFREAVVPSTRSQLESAVLASHALDVVLGTGMLAAVVLFALLGAWAFAPTAIARRLCAWALLSGVVLWNPFAASWIAANVTSAPTYWRVLWVLPVPLFVGLLLTSPLCLRHGAPWLGRALSIALALVVLGALPSTFALGARNHVEWSGPSWRIPAAELEAARAVAAAAGPGAPVLAPLRVAPWLVTFEGHPEPLVVRPAYLPVLYEVLGGAELARRLDLMRLVSGATRAPHAETLLGDALERGLVAVVLARSTERWPELRSVLSRSGLGLVFENADYEVWAR